MTRFLQFSLPKKPFFGSIFLLSGQFRAVLSARAGQTAGKIFPARKSKNPDCKAPHFSLY